METHIRIKPSWQIFTGNDTLIFYNSYGKGVSFLFNDVMKQLLQLLSNPIAEKEFANRLAANIPATKKDIKALIDRMKSLHILEKYLPIQIEAPAHQKFQTQLSFFDLLQPLPSLQSKLDLQKKLQATKMLVIGCGGIGCSLLQSIAAAGIEQITIIDGDRVELNNLGKQLLFTHEDIGEYKTVAAANQLRRIAPDAIVTPITTFINNAIQLQDILEKNPKPDFIFLSADDPSLPLWLDTVCKNLQLSFMKVSYLGSVGFIGPLIIPGGKRFSEIIQLVNFDELQNEFTRLHNRNHKHASTVFTNSIIANLAITECLKFILHLGHVKTIARRLYFNFETMEPFFDDEEGY